MSLLSKILDFRLYWLVFLCDTTIIRFINTFGYISVNFILIVDQFTNTTTPKTIT